MSYYKYTSEQRVIAFWNKVDKNGSIPAHCPELGNCWEWIRPVSKRGYAQFRVDTIKTGAHRFSWELVNGKIPDGLFVLHKCDNRKCVNPNHLFLGTNQDNMNDRNFKNRQAKLRGELNGVSVLKDKDILEIRNKYEKEGIIQSELARMYSVTPQHIWQIVHYKQWKHI